MKQSPDRMPGQLRTLISAGKWYALAEVAMRGAGYLALPIYTAFLKPEEYGVVGTLGSMAQLLLLLAMAGVPQAYGRSYFPARREGAESVQVLFSTLFWFLGAWSVFWYLLTLWPVGLIARTFDIPFWPWVPLAMLPCLFLPVARLCQRHLQNELETARTSGIDAAGRFVEHLTGASLVGAGLGITGRLFGTAVGVVVIAVAAVRVLFRRGLIAAEFSRKVLFEQLRYAVVLIPGNAMGWVNLLADRLILGWFQSLAAVGIYTVSAQLAGILGLLTEAFGRVQVALVLEAFARDREEGYRQIREYSILLFWLLGGVWLGLSLLAPEVVLIFDRDYADASLPVALLSGALIISALLRVLLAVLAHDGRAADMTITYLLGGGANIALNLLLVPRFGMIAAAWATVFSTLAGLLWAMRAVGRKHRLKLPFETLLLLTLLLLGIFLAAPFVLAQIAPETLLSVITMKVALVLAYFLLSLLSPMVRGRVQRQWLRRKGADEN